MEYGSLANEYYRITNKDIGIRNYKDEDGLDQVAIKDRLLKGIDDHLNSKEAKLGFELMRLLKKFIICSFMDHSWKEHLWL
jgi:preprotein translocase subunit SecA